MRVVSRRTGSKVVERPPQDGAWLRAVLGAALDCIVAIDHEGCVLEFNPAAEATFGYTRTEALGRPIADLLVPERLREAHIAGLERCVATGEGRLLGRRVEMPARRADGSEILVELAITRVELPGPPVFTAYVREIGDRKRAEQELRESRELYRLVVESSSDLIALIELDGRLVYSSPAHDEGSGYPSVTLADGDFLELVHPDDIASVRALFADCVRGTRGSFPPIRIRQPNGDWAHVEGSMTGIDDADGQVRFVLLTARDVGTRIRAERQRERRERAEREFVANAAHELQTPLTAIRAAAEVLEAGAKDRPERDEFLADIRHQTSRLESLTQALLELERLQASDALPPVEPIEVRSMLDEVADMLPRRDGVVIMVEGPAGLYALAARDLLERALWNVAINAVEHTTTGSVELRARRDGTWIEVEVRDTGCGIAREDCAHLFDRFYRGNGEPSHGFGLGLAIAHEATRVLGGTIEIESSLGEGTTARLRLPAG